MKKVLEIIALPFQIVFELCKNGYLCLVAFEQQRKIKRMFLKMKKFNEKAIVDFTIVQERRITQTWLLDPINLEHVYGRPITTKDAVILEKERMERVLTILQNNLKIANQSLAYIKELENAENDNL